jgi:hypothetical protein
MPKLKPNPTELLADEVCSVCLLEMEKEEWIRKTVCGHIFHQECLDVWCRANLNCPICRKSFELARLKDESLLSESSLEIDESGIRKSLV